MADTNNDEIFLKDAKEAFAKAAEAEDENRQDAMEDLRFARLAEQWPAEIQQHRAQEYRPCLTINKMPAFIRQVVNDARQNKPSIKVRPVDSNADLKTADVMSGLIRNIEYQSNAEVAYDTAADFAVSSGFGYFRINIDYSHDDTFERDLKIERVANPFSIYGDPASEAADSSDWNSAFVTKSIHKDEFEKLYKGAEETNWDDLGYGDLQDPWRDDDFIMVAEYWRRELVEKQLLLLSDGTPILEDVWKRVGDDLMAAGLTVTNQRKVKAHKVTSTLMTGAEVLESSDWVGKYIPLVPVYGEEVNAEGKRYFRSLIRDAKDAQRNFNYWRTAAAELVALAPKAPWVGEEGSFDVDTDKWASANTDTHAFLEYAIGKPPPQRQPFAGVPAGALQEALNSSDDIKSIVGLYDAALGARSNETSGRAILARQREGDVSTFHFIDNLSRAIRHAGRILIDLIPHVYTGNRVVRVLGEQGEVDRVQLNTPIMEPPDQPPMGAGMEPQDGEASNMPTPQIYNFTAGRYDLAVDTGPSFTTRREEAAAQMTELIRAFPPAAPVLGDLLAKNLDWPGAEEIAKRLQSINPAAQQENPQVQAGLKLIAEMKQKISELEADKMTETGKLMLEGKKVKIAAYEAETKRLQEMIKAGLISPEYGAMMGGVLMQQILDGPDIAPAPQGEGMNGPGVPPTPNGGFPGPF